MKKFVKNLLAFCIAVGIVSVIFNLTHPKAVNVGRVHAVDLGSEIMLTISSDRPYDLQDIQEALDTLLSE